MPTYDYQCEHCSHLFEAFHGIKETPNLSCPQCKTQKVKRKISKGAGIHFKGSGFYVNDYKKKQSNSTSTQTEPPKPKSSSAEKKETSSSVKEKGNQPSKKKETKIQKN